MPRLLLMSAFGDSELAQNMVYFLEHLEQAEHTLTEKDLRLLTNISVKDRGPILYWLINERASCPPLAAPATLHSVFFHARAPSCADPGCRILP